MATLLNTKPSETYKDLLTVASDTRNQGLESSVKQVFDGEGIGSPLYLSTTTVHIGNSTTSGGANMKVFGQVQAENFTLMEAISGNTHSVLSVNTDGTVNFIAPIITKSSVTFRADGYDDMVMDAQNSSMKRGDGSKGNVKLGATDVTLQKGSTNLLTAKADGTIQFQNISNANKPGSPSTGDLALIDGDLQIGV